MKNDNRRLTAEKVAAALLSIGAVFLRPDEPFTWASGIRSPIYCDNRLTLTAVAERGLIENSVAERVREKYPDCDALVGTATAGIPHAAIAAHILGKPMGYVRSGAKDHGRENRIEGKLEAGMSVVIIEDLISTAGSAVEVAEALREAGLTVLGIVSIFTYGMKRGLERLAAAELENTSLTDFDTLVGVAADEGYITPSDIARLKAFRDNPSDEGWRSIAG